MLFLQEQFLCAACRSHFLPDSDEVVWPMNLKQGEVQFDAEARSHGDQPGAVSWAGVLLWITRREDGPIVWGDVSTTWHWEEDRWKEK